MLRSLLVQIKDKLLLNNEVFGTNGFVYTKTLEKTSGVSDKYANQVFFKILEQSNKQYEITKISEPNLYSVSANMRCVIQIQSDIDITTSMNSILYQLDEWEEVAISSATADNQHVRELEEIEDGVIRDFNLAVIDFEISDELSFRTCDPICFPESRIKLKNS